ncbi:glycine betaine ABC transporter substrate-binding protein [Alkalicoccus chagannorensis]|uniref:glycine betaine ABC transporter substrate-binding protein n=1 Tax=Alkalicoccus chagannorensis TaxID=427072 RepID=UPI00040D8EBD|nr:glycine betaine ABC transporter substrate-binding protein [Alkalicoccus chagannorensis]
MNFKKNQLVGAIGMTALLAAATACGNENDNTAEENTNNNGEAEASGESIGEQVDYEIVGIDPGTGIMDNAEIAIEEYDLDENWSVLSSSGPVMTAELGEAIDNEEPVVVTGWQPHWKFMEYDLKFLEDPELVFGEGEDIHTLTRTGLEEDMPGAFPVIDQFSWEMSDMEEVMMMAEEEDTEVDEAARQWVDDNEDMVAEWTEGAEEGDGELIEFTLVNWADALAATNVVSEVLKDLNYETDLVEVMIDAMYTGLATDGADAMFASWLPGQQQYYDEYEEDFVDLGPNTEGTRLGLVVPEYMDIDSIEDLRELEE